MRQLLNESGFKKTIKSIGKMTDLLATNIHEAGMFALQQANEHGNVNFAVDLVQALGKKHRAEAVKNWLVHFGNLGYSKEKGIHFRKRKDITDENMGAWLEKADACPFYDLTPETPAKISVDYLSMLQSILNKHKTIAEKEKEGIKVEEKHLNVIIEVQKLLDKLTPKKEDVGLKTIPSHSSVS